MGAPKTLQQAILFFADYEMARFMRRFAAGLRIVLAAPKRAPAPPPKRTRRKRR